MRKDWLSPSLAAAAALVLMACEPAPARLLRHPYLQAVTPHAATVVWRTQGPIEPVVRYGLAPDELERTSTPEHVTVLASAPAADEAAGVLHSAPPGCYQYEVRLESLEPDTEYFYAVCDGTEVLAGGDSGHSLRTAPGPDSDRALRLWVVGDSGMGNVAQRRVLEAVQAFTAGEGVPLDAVVHLGDMAYQSGTDQEFQDHFFVPYQELLQRTPCWPTLGNHEGLTSDSKSATGPYFDAFVVPAEGEAGGAPSGTEAWYSFDLGPVHLVSLNSHGVDRSREGEMGRWLEEDLAAASAPWLIAFCHHPPYSRGTHDSDRERPMVQLREELLPVLEEAGVDLFLAGHSHTYERSVLIDGMVGPSDDPGGMVLDDGDGDPEGDGAYRKSPGRVPHEGTVAVVAGTGGGALGQQGTFPVMHCTLVEYGSLLLDVTTDRLTVRMVDAQGAVRDRFAIDRTAPTSAGPGR